MRISLLILLMHFISGACLNASAQGGEELIDIDRDGAADTLRMDTERGVIVCILSSHDFKPVESLPIDYLEWSWLETENGDVHLVRNFNRYTEYSTFG